MANSLFVLTRLLGQKVEDAVCDILRYSLGRVLLIRRGGSIVLDVSLLVHFSVLRIIRLLGLGPLFAFLLDLFREACLCKLHRVRKHEILDVAEKLVPLGAQHAFLLQEHKVVCKNVHYLIATILCGHDRVIDDAARFCRRWYAKDGTLPRYASVRECVSVVLGEVFDVFTHSKDQHSNANVQAIFQFR